MNLRERKAIEARALQLREELLRGDPRALPVEGPLSPELLQAAREKKKAERAQERSREWQARAAAAEKVLATRVVELASKGWLRSAIARELKLTKTQVGHYVRLHSPTLYGGANP